MRVVKCLIERRMTKKGIIVAIKMTVKMLLIVMIPTI